MSTSIYNYQRPFYQDGDLVGIDSADGTTQSGYVTTEAQTIGGVKTFTTPPKSLLDPTADAEAATLNYITIDTNNGGFVQWQCKFDDELSVSHGSTVYYQFRDNYKDPVIDFVPAQATKVDDVVTLTIGAFRAKTVDGDNNTCLKTTGTSNVPVGFRPAQTITVLAPVYWLIDGSATNPDGTINIYIRMPEDFIDVAAAGIAWGELIEQCLTIIDTIMTLWGIITSSSKEVDLPEGFEVGRLTIDTDGSIIIRRPYGGFPHTYGSFAGLGWDSWGGDISITYPIN